MAYMQLMEFYSTMNHPVEVKPSLLVKLQERSKRFTSLLEMPTKDDPNLLNSRDKAEPTNPVAPAIKMVIALV